MRGAVQCEVFDVGHHRGHWGHFGPPTGIEGAMFACGPHRCGDAGRHGPGIPGFPPQPGRHGHHGKFGHGHHGHGHHHGPGRWGHPGRHGHHGPHGKLGRRSDGPGCSSPESSPDRCGCKCPDHTRRTGPSGSEDADKSDGQCHQKRAGHKRGHGCHGKHGHRRHGCNGIKKSKFKRCKPFKKHGKCCGGTSSDSDNSKSGNETCDRGTSTENPKGPTVVIERLVLGKAPRCYSV